MLKINMTALEDNMKRIFIFLLCIMGTVGVSAQKDSLSVASHSKTYKDPVFPEGPRSF